jgi:hypothetical protein
MVYLVQGKARHGMDGGIWSTRGASCIYRVFEISLLEWRAAPYRLARECDINTNMIHKRNFSLL